MDLALLLGICLVENVSDPARRFAHVEFDGDEHLAAFTLHFHTA